MATTDNDKNEDTRHKSVTLIENQPTDDNEEDKNMYCCTCKKIKAKPVIIEKEPDPAIIQGLLAEQEKKLRAEHEQTLNKAKRALKEKFNFILEHEQARSSCMLREAHRERQEKVAALHQQLECKNLAAMMYVMCTEKAKCKMEKLQIIESYTNYINMLNQILNEGQALILNLSRGYKTAARVDAEWREKMNKVIEVFLQFIYHFTGAPPEQNQYFFNLPEVLSVDASKQDDPEEDPIEKEESFEDKTNDDGVEIPEELTWWQKMGNEDLNKRPFVVYGDMGDFKPQRRRETLKYVKAQKTAPKKWKEYDFDTMFLKSDCPNADLVKDEYLNRLPDTLDKWDCFMYSLHENRSMLNREPSALAASRRMTAASVDIRGNMGSILKIITGATFAEPVTKANLLGARDSMEIASTTRLRTKSRSFDADKIKIGERHTVYRDSREGPNDEVSSESSQKEDCECPPSAESGGICGESKTRKKINIKVGPTIRPGSGSSTPPTPATPAAATDNEEIPPIAKFGKKGHTDSLEVIPKHIPDPDHKINYEKICPMPKCQRMHMDTFWQALPNYMKANPFTQFDQTFDEYETCTPEQLEILKQRLDEKKRKEKNRQSVTMDPMLEWAPSIEGIGVQTSDSLFELADDDLPPCTCQDPCPSPVSGVGGVVGKVFRMEDLIPMKQKVDQVARECLWDEDIEFKRFKVVGEADDRHRKEVKELYKIKSDFTRKRLEEIQKILKEHPSLLEIFQANARC